MGNTVRKLENLYIQKMVWAGLIMNTRWHFVLSFCNQSKVRKSIRPPVALNSPPLFYFYRILIFLHKFDNRTVFDYYIHFFPDFYYALLDLL